MKFFEELAYTLLKAMEANPDPNVPRLYFPIGHSGVPRVLGSATLGRFFVGPQPSSSGWIQHWPESLRTLDWYAKLMAERGFIELYEGEPDERGIGIRQRGGGGVSKGYRRFDHSPKSLTMAGIEYLRKLEEAPGTIGFVKDH